MFICTYDIAMLRYDSVFELRIGFSEWSRRLYWTKPALSRSNRTRRTRYKTIASPRCIVSADYILMYRVKNMLTKGGGGTFQPQTHSPRCFLIEILIRKVTQ